MDAKLVEMVTVAFANVEDLKVELLKRRDVAKTKDEQHMIDEVLGFANDAHQLLAEMRVQVKKNF